MERHVLASNLQRLSFILRFLRERKGEGIHLYEDDFFMENFALAEKMQMGRNYTKLQRETFFRMLDDLWKEDQLSFPVVWKACQRQTRRDALPPNKGDKDHISLVSKILSTLEPRYPEWNGRMTRKLLGFSESLTIPAERLYARLLERYWHYEMTEIAKGRSIADELVAVGSRVMDRVSLEPVALPERRIIAMVLNRWKDIPVILEDDRETRERWWTVRREVFPLSMLTGHEAPLGG